MNIKHRLSLLSFLEFFVWSPWIFTISSYWFGLKQWDENSFNSILTTTGIATIVMAIITGIIADKWINAEKLMGFYHIVGAVILFFIPKIDNPNLYLVAIALYACFYMPTLALTNTISFALLRKNGSDVIDNYPKICVWSIYGFVVGIWLVSLLGFENSAHQYHLASAISLCLGIYCFTMPAVKPLWKYSFKVAYLSLFQSKTQVLLSKNKSLITFFLFSFLFGIALEFTNGYIKTFFKDLINVETYQDRTFEFYSAIMLTISHISETIIVLCIPKLYKRYGIKILWQISIASWAALFIILALAKFENKLLVIFVSWALFRLAYVYFKIAGAMYVDSPQVDQAHRATAQSIFLTLTCGVGLVFGAVISKVIITFFFTNIDHSINWSGVWVCFAIYSLLIFYAFSKYFKQGNVIGIKGKQIVENIAKGFFLRKATKC